MRKATEQHPGTTTPPAKRTCKESPVPGNDPVPAGKAQQPLVNAQQLPVPAENANKPLENGQQPIVNAQQPLDDTQQPLDDTPQLPVPPTSVDDTPQLPVPPMSVEDTQQSLEDTPPASSFKAVWEKFQRGRTSLHLQCHSRTEKAPEEMALEYLSEGDKFLSEWDKLGRSIATTSKEYNAVLNGHINALRQLRTKMEEIVAGSNDTSAMGDQSKKVVTDCKSDLAAYFKQYHAM